MIFKLLVFGLVIFVVYTFFFKVNRGTVEQPKRKEKKKKIDGDTMVECTKCSVFISETEAIIKDGKFFCSKECAGLK
ncbi:MAG: Prokaryotic metallothionein [Epsilonproteobacteria bacterium]|nr:Prokaryotic metallothionein [Campylobacterota bacterium]